MVVCSMSFFHRLCTDATFTLTIQCLSDFGSIPFHILSYKRLELNVLGVVFGHRYKIKAITNILITIKEDFDEHFN